MKSTIIVPPPDMLLARHLEYREEHWNTTGLKEQFAGWQSWRPEQFREVMDAHYIPPNEKSVILIKALNQGVCLSDLPPYMRDWYNDAKSLGRDGSAICSRYAQLHAMYGACQGIRNDSINKFVPELQRWFEKAQEQYTQLYDEAKKEGRVEREHQTPKEFMSGIIDDIQRERRRM